MLLTPTGCRVGWPGTGLLTCVLCNLVYNFSLLIMHTDPLTVLCIMWNRAIPDYVMWPLRVWSLYASRALPFALQLATMITDVMAMMMKTVVVMHMEVDFHTAVDIRTAVVSERAAEEVMTMMKEKEKVTSSLVELDTTDRRDTVCYSRSP
jgi:hypothetical protein